MMWSIRAYWCAKASRQIDFLWAVQWIQFDGSALSDDTAQNAVDLRQVPNMREWEFDHQKVDEMGY